MNAIIETVEASDPFRHRLYAECSCGWCVTSSPDHASKLAFDHCAQARKQRSKTSAS
jgi:hypothetical protein